MQTIKIRRSLLDALGPVERIFAEQRIKAGEFIIIEDSPDHDATDRDIQ
jgi:hypothetical protein